MKWVLKVFYFFMLYILVTSCWKGGYGRLIAPQYTLIPGECIDGDKFIVSTAEDNSIRVCLATKGLETYYDKWGDKVHYSYIKDEILELFPRENREAVRTRFDDFQKQIFVERDGVTNSISTVLCDGKISITANKGFGDFLAGEDLSALFLISPPGRRCLKGDALEVYDIPQKGRAFAMEDILTPGIAVYGQFTLQLASPEKYDMVSGSSVELSISLPVKVGMLLNNMNESITQPGADINFIATTLRGSITLPWNIVPSFSTPSGK